MDVSVRALEQAARRLKLDEMHDAQRQRIELLQSALTYRDKRLVGFDAAALVEVIEHLDPPRLAALEQNVFGSARPGTVVVTTPNAEYNVRWETLPAGEFRHPDHRFEWTRASSPAGATGSPTRTGTRSATCRSGLRIPRSARRRRWRCSRGEARPSGSEPGGADRRRRARARARSRASTSRATEVISSDFCRGLVADDENDQARDRRRVRGPAVHRRPAAGPAAVHGDRRDQRAARGAAAAGRARQAARPVPGRDRARHPGGGLPGAQPPRPDRDFGPHVVRQQTRAAAQVARRACSARGFAACTCCAPPEEVDAAEIQRTPLWTDRRTEHGPFDVIGDIHGCSRRARRAARPSSAMRSPATGSTVTAAGGPPRGVRRRLRRSRTGHARRCCELVMAMAEAGTAICLPGNHDVKLVRKLKGRDVQITHGLAETLEQLEPGAGRVPRPGPRLPRPAGQPCRAGRRRAGRRARRDEAELPGPLLRPRARLRAVRRDDRRDRRVRPAGAAASGRATTAARRRSSTATPRSPSPSGSTTRSTSTPAACSAAGSPRCAGPNASSSPSPRTATYYEPAKPLPRQDAEPTAAEDRPALPARHRRRRRQADHRDRAGPHGHHPRGERRRGAGGHEPLRDRPALADLPAADDGADRRPPSAPTCSSIPRTRSPSTAPRASPQVICEEKHMGSRAVVIVCRDAAAARDAVRRRHRRDRRDLHPHRPPLPRQPRRDRGRRSAASAPPPTPPASGTSSRHGWLAARLRAAAMVGQSDGPHPPPVRLSRRRRPRGTERQRSRPSNRPPPAASTSAP